MPFGLCNAAQTFQRFIDQVLRGLPFCYAYIDDMLIASSSPEEHQSHLRQVLKRLSEHGIVINLANSVLGVSHQDFLGHRVDAQGISPLDEKVRDIRNFPQPNLQHQLREFLGLINFYHCFIPNCAAILEPLNSMLSPPTKGKQDLIWDVMKPHLPSPPSGKPWPMPHFFPTLNCTLRHASWPMLPIGQLELSCSGLVTDGSRQPTSLESSVLLKLGTAHSIESSWQCTSPSSTSATSSKVVSSMCLPITNCSHSHSSPILTSTLHIKFDISTISPNSPETFDT